MRKKLINELSNNLIKTQSAIDLLKGKIEKIFSNKYGKDLSEMHIDLNRYKNLVHEVGEFWIRSLNTGISLTGC